MFWFILSDFLTQKIPLCGFRTFYEFRVVLHSGKKIKEGTRQLPCTQSNAFLTFHLVFSDNKVGFFSAYLIIAFWSKCTAMKAMINTASKYSSGTYFFKLNIVMYVEQSRELSLAGSFDSQVKSVWILYFKVFTSIPTIGHKEWL